MALIIVIVIFFLFVVPVILTVVIHQYNKNRQIEQDAVVVFTIDAINSSQQLFFTENNRWSTSYEELSALSLVKDSNVNYGPIQIKNNGMDYSFSVSHVAPNSPLFISDSAYTEHRYRIVPGEGLESSVW
ncbi:MAG: type IV pilin-like G/H family protein [Deltaproteobacteria bacterium]|nr:type IV pilin-like G/H family protein [Deltaproteobacteria bacterium]